MRQAHFVDFSGKIRENWLDVQQTFDPMEEREEIEKAITELEAQREKLGGAAVDAALTGLYQRLAELDGLQGQYQAPAPVSRRAGERRVVTVLFCDVAGSTALAERMDPEAWTEVMNAAFQHLIQPVQRYGGTVARLMGDAILAFFGAPVAHEDDPQRAVLAGLGIVEGIQSFREKLRREKGFDFNVRVGINTGLAVVGDVGSQDAAEYTAMGDAVNVAARMEQAAQPGSVLIAQDTYSLVAPLFDWEPVGGVQVKGKSRPIPAFKVLARKLEPGNLRGLTGHGIRSPLVAREGELAVAQAAFAQLMEGEGGILMILGEAGIGKSRLLTEIREDLLPPAPPGADRGVTPQVEDPHFTWLQGNTFSYGQNISYGPFQEILRSYTGITEEDGEAEAWFKLEASISHLFTGAKGEVLPYLSSLPGIKVHEDYVESVKYLAGEALKRQIFRSSRLFFHRLAERKPLVLVLDDLHWLDASSADLLEHLLPLTKRAPILVCGLSRPEPGTFAERLRRVAQSEYAAQFAEIELRPLSTSESNQLVHYLLEVDDLPASVRQMMVDKADGNPFFLEELIRALIQAGALVYEQSKGRWRATKQIETIDVPDTVQGLIISRIDRLDEKLQRVVRRAAAIGRTFRYRLLESVLPDTPDLEECLHQLHRIELIQEARRYTELAYTFKHALAQQAAYDGILQQERRELHAQVGSAIELLMADRLDEFYGVLAFHYSAAEKWEQAQQYLFKAGDQAHRIAADAEALAHYRKAMEAYARARGDDWAPLERARLERKIGEALFRLGEHDQARAYLERALALLGEGLPVSQKGTRVAILRGLLTQVGHRLFSHRFLRAASRSTDPAAEEIFLAVVALGWVELGADLERYLLLALRALNASERGGFAYGSAYFASTMAPALIAFGFPGLAERYFRLATEYARRVDPYRPVFVMQVGLAYKFNLLGQIDKSLEHALRGAEIAQRSGELREWGAAMLTAVWAYYFQGDLVKAVEVAREMIEKGEDGADRQVVAWGLSGLGTSQRRLGQIEQAIANLERAKELAGELPDYSGQKTAGSWLARCYLAIGDQQQALTVLEEVTSIEIDSSTTPYLDNSLTEAYLSSAENAVGEARQKWMVKAKRASKRALKAARNNRPTMPDALLLRGRYEWLRKKPAAALHWWNQGLEEALRMGEIYMEGMVHLEIGLRMEDSEHLRQAGSILEPIEAEFDLIAVREALTSLQER